MIWLLAIALSHFSVANFEHTIEENLYDSYYDQIQNRGRLIYSEIENKKVFVDALWDSVTIDEVVTFSSLFSELQEQPDIEIADLIRLDILESWPEQSKLTKKTRKSIRNAVFENKLSDRDFATLFAYDSHLRNVGALKFLLSKRYPVKFQNIQRAQASFRDKTNQEIQDLYFNSPDLSEYREGRYQNGVRLFMFCRYTRRYKCIMVMKDQNNQPVLTEDGQTLWHHEALGMSKKGLPSWQRNGNTPEGVLTIDGVMPYANKQAAFGKYRRLILDFLPKSENEAHNKQFLPNSAHDKNWWNSAIVARDVGRSALRIHGTGTKDSSPKDPHHPLRPTLGCVMQRELTFGSTTYRDQRYLLDTMMTAQGLEPTYENEAKLVGVLYVIELDKTQKNVTFSDVQEILGM